MRRKYPHYQKLRFKQIKIIYYFSNKKKDIICLLMKNWVMFQLRIFINSLCTNTSRDMISVISEAFIWQLQFNNNDFSQLDIYWLITLRFVDFLKLPTVWWRLISSPTKRTGKITSLDKKFSLRLAMSSVQTANVT